MPKISGFCLTTNSLERGYPVIESITSFLPMVDELIVIDGGSTDGTIEAIQAIGDSKIRIISDETTKWEDDWAYGRMTRNFDRGYQECSGDIAVKFDIDYVAHEGTWNGRLCSDFRKDCKFALDTKKLILAFTRKNLILPNSYFVKKIKTLGVNKTLVKELSLNVRYGLDLEGWSWGNEPVIFDHEENGVNFGKLLRTRNVSYEPCCDIYNYGFMFQTMEQVKNIRLRHMLAEARQQEVLYTTIEQPIPAYTIAQLTENPNLVWDKFVSENEANMRRFQVPMVLGEHPKVIQDKIRALTPEQQGYNFWGIKII